MVSFSFSLDERAYLVATMFDRHARQCQTTKLGHVPIGRMALDGFKHRWNCPSLICLILRTSHHHQHQHQQPRHKRREEGEKKKKKRGKKKKKEAASIHRQQTHTRSKQTATYFLHLHCTHTVIK
jgi:hypothetical protein